ncbi:MAG: transposase [Opitutaceae bacterium]|jgi:transposase
MLTPNVRKTWAPVGQTPILRHSYRHDRVSVISAITISSAHQWIGRYFRCHRDNINGERVVESLRLLLRHLRGEVVLLWDRAKIHRNEAVRQYLHRCRRLHLHHFPAYAPELNPDEHVWTQTKQTLANTTPATVDELESGVGQALLHLQHSPWLLWSCIDTSELPWN